MLGKIGRLQIQTVVVVTIKIVRLTKNSYSFLLVFSKIGEERLNVQFLIKLIVLHRLWLDVLLKIHTLDDEMMVCGWTPSEVT